MHGVNFSKTSNQISKQVYGIHLGLNREPITEETWTSRLNKPTSERSHTFILLFWNHKKLVDNLLYKTKKSAWIIVIIFIFQAFDLWYQSEPFELRLYCRHHIYRKITIRRCLSIMSRCIYHNWPILGHKFGPAQCFGQRSGNIFLKKFT